MSDPKNIKDQVRKLLDSDQRYQAIRLIQNTYGVSEADAQKLLGTLEKDEPNRVTLSGQASNPGCGGCLSGTMKAGSILSGLLALLFLGLTAFFYYFYEDFKKDAVPVRGIVADAVYAEPASPTDTLKTVYLIFRYQFNDSLYTYQTATSYPEYEYPVQDSVDLLVNGNNPEYASLPADEVMEDFYLIFGIAAGVMLFIAIVLWFLGRSVRAAPAQRVS
ncbi:MAG: hypothetical protein KIT62_09525 [Cyclobacteriaceae bacterium]|nr:hypothetical protein [Cyclobacteriaceae bacterium]